MNNWERGLKKRFVVFCEGLTEYNYIDKMRKNQGVEIVLKPINMQGGGYSSFLKQIRRESKSNCIAKFIIVDGDRLQKEPNEKEPFLELVEYCDVQNKYGTVPHFLIVNNPDFEYVSCLHFPGYIGQDVLRFLKEELGIKDLAAFKRTRNIYDILNDGYNSYSVMTEKVRGKDKFVQNEYEIKRNSFDVKIDNTSIDWDKVDLRGSNMEEFFDVINW